MDIIGYDQPLGKCPGIGEEMDMSDVERRLYKLLLLADGLAIFISMVAGPLDHTSISIGAAASALLISLCLVGYGIWFWPKNR